MTKGSTMTSILITVATITILISATHRTFAQASTTNLYDGHLKKLDGSQLYHSSTELDQKLGISSSGTVVTQAGAPWPGSAYRALMWDGPLYNERINSNGQREAYIFDNEVDQQDVRSEGMSYAMMIAVQAGDQYRFDLLHNFVLNHMKMSNGFIVYHVDRNGNNIDGYGFAPDGDEWYTTALIMAYHRWHNTSYINEAWGNLWQYANSGAMFDTNPKVVQFNGNQLFDPSYLTPAFYLIWWNATGNNNSNYSNWMSWTGGDGACWNSVNQSSRNLLNVSAQIGQSNGNGNTYLFHPNVSNLDGSVAGSYGGYGPDAMRTCMNAALDAQWYGQTNTYWRFCRDRQDYYFYATPRQYSANGGVGELAMNTCAGEGYSWSDYNNEAGAFADKLWQASIPGDYYNAYIYYLGMLVSTGRFKNY